MAYSYLITIGVWYLKVSVIGDFLYGNLHEFI